jgi:hypothetical protein
MSFSAAFANLIAASTARAILSVFIANALQGNERQKRQRNCQLNPEKGGCI